MCSGAAMRVIDEENDLEEFLTEAATVSREHPVVLSKFVKNAKEIEFDAVANNGTVINYAVSEHIENAGVHSGDATLLLPAQKLYVETVRRVKRIGSAICEELKVTGPINIQFLSKANDIKVIECNLRASRSFPFVSKTFNVNFIELATKAMLGRLAKAFTVDLYDTEWVCCKSSMFSFGRLLGADPITRVEMASTGEVACFGFDQHEALIKSLMSANFKLPLNKPDRRAAMLISVGPEKDKIDFLECMKVLEKRFKIYTTSGTHKYYTEHGVESELVLKPDADDDVGQKDAKQALDLIADKQVDLVIAIPAGFASASITSGYKIRRHAVDFGVSLMTNTKLATAFVQAIEHVNIENLPVRHWDEYVDPATRADEGENAILLPPWQTPLHMAKHADPKNIKAADGRVADALAI